MMIKLTSSEIDLSTANTVSNARVVKIYNPNGVGVVTRKDSEGVIIGSCTIAAASDYFLEKEPTDTLESTVAVKAAAIAYAN